MRQGDPIAPLLFSLGIRPTLELLQRTLPPNTTITAYLDDIYIFGASSAKILPQVAQVFRDSPVTLNPTKSSEASISALKTKGLKALGSFIGPLHARRAFLQGKISALSSALDAIRDLPKQHALLLLKGSLHLLLRHLLRQLNPQDLQDLWEQADSLIEAAIQALIARSPYDKAAPL